MTYEENEIERDPELAAALRLVETEPPFAEVDWDALRQSVVARAEMPLARRRTRSARLHRWTRPLVPLAAAASIALTVWFNGRTGSEPSTGPMADSRPAAVAPSVTPEDVFQADVSEQQFQLMVSGRDNADALLLVAIGES